jgi:hypothetical protein
MIEHIEWVFSFDGGGDAAADADDVDDDDDMMMVMVLMTMVMAITTTIMIMAMVIMMMMVVIMMMMMMVMVTGQAEEHLNVGYRTQWRPGIPHVHKIYTFLDVRVGCPVDQSAQNLKPSSQKSIFSLPLDHQLASLPHMFVVIKLNSLLIEN